MIGPMSRFVSLRNSIEPSGFPRSSPAKYCSLPPATNYQYDMNSSGQGLQVFLQTTQNLPLRIEPSSPTASGGETGHRSMSATGMSYAAGIGSSLVRRASLRRSRAPLSDGRDYHIGICWVCSLSYEYSANDPPLGPSPTGWRQIAPQPRHAFVDV
jgi:hypothetical protein